MKYSFLQKLCEILMLSLFVIKIILFYDIIYVTSFKKMLFSTMCINCEI